MAGGNGCERLSVKIAFPFGCIPSTKTITNKLTIKMEMKIPNKVIVMVTTFVITILMRMDKIAANKPR